MIKTLYRRVRGVMPVRVRASLGYLKGHGSLPHLRAPRKFTEWVQHRKVYDRDPRLPELADKVLVKGHVSTVLGPDWVIPTLWHGPALPPRAERDWPLPFVLKANNASAANIFVRSPENLNWDWIEATVAPWPRRRYAHYVGEWLYGVISYQLLVEPYVGALAHTPVDLKFWTFHGRVATVQVDTGRHVDHKRCFYSRDWIKQPYGLGYPMEEREIPRPATFDAMVAGAETLGRPFAFVRVDLYEIDGRPLFGEMTFYPESGNKRFTDERVDHELGRLWRSGPRREIA